MELRITNPQESWLTEQILWNNEELKAAIAEKVKDYKTIAYTEDSLKDMKADRADLNKLKKASKIMSFCVNQIACTIVIA